MAVRHVNFINEARIKYNGLNSKKQFCLDRDFCDDCPQRQFCRYITFITSLSATLLDFEDFEVSRYMKRVEELRHSL